MRGLVILAVLLAAAPAQAQAQALSPSPVDLLAPPVDYASLTIAISLRPLAWGGGADFDLTIKGDGSVNFVPGPPARGGETEGPPRSGTISRATLDALLTQFRLAGFAQMQPYYDSGVTDQARLELNVTTALGTRRISFDYFYPDRDGTRRFRRQLDFIDCVIDLGLRAVSLKFLPQPCPGAP